MVERMTKGSGGDEGEIFAVVQFLATCAYLRAGTIMAWEKK